MRIRFFVATATAVAALVGIVSGHRPPVALADRACPGAGVMPAATVAANGVLGAAVPPTDVSGPTMLRHVATGPAGTAVVLDRPGDDDVIVSTLSGSMAIPQRGEIAHPAWGPRASLAWGLDDRLVLRSARGAIRSVPGPVPDATIVAPVFDGRDVVAVVSAAPTRAVPEDEWSNDLWRYRSDRDRWVRLTVFPAGADRWTAIRTPFATPDGSIEFVVIRGRASQTRMPHFSLWRLRDNRVTRLASLPDERYLAGFDGEGARLWNVPDRANARWLIERETTSGEEMIGCGAVAVDPMDVVDPDRTGHGAPPAATRHDAMAEVSGDPIESALLVGDFASETAAGVVAQQVARAYGNAVPVDVIRGGPRSGVLQPGHWAVVVRLPGTTDGSAELDAFRAALPALAAHVWIAVP
jgi:hypothetical protein